LFKKLETALFFSFIAIILFFLLVFALIATPRIRSLAINQISTELGQQMQLEAERFSSLIASRQSTAVIQSASNKTAQLVDSRITVIALDGRVRGDSATPLAQLGELENHLSRPEIKSALKLGQGQSVQHSTTIDQDLIYVAMPLTNQSGQISGFLRFSVPATYANQLVLRIYKSMFWAFVAAIFIAIVLSMVFSRSFARPIVKLVDVANNIAKGYFPQNILHKSKFEVGKLEQAVEDMSIKLAATFEKLSFKRSQLSAILASMSEGVTAVDLNQKLFLVNPAMEKTFTVIEPEILGRTLREGLRNNEIAGLVAQALAEGRFIEREIAIVTPVERTFLALASPIKTQGQIVGVVCVLHDITELRKLERHRSEFAANVSHELKTPLTAIRNYVETLLDGAIDDKKHNMEFLQKIDKHATNLSSLIDDILEVSRLETRKELGQFVKVDLHKLIEGAIETVSNKVKKKNIRLILSCQGTDLLVSGLAEHLYRAILNLLDNAVNYTAEGGKVEITCQKSDQAIALTVADTGFGIPAEHLERIFERFYRVDQARSRELGGTGLGLAIVKHVMNLHNGNVSVESVEGQGSSFTLTFPA